MYISLTYVVATVNNQPYMAAVYVSKFVDFSVTYRAAEY